tara:strand:+ start:534 stop:941 length:408 start_codon:yes stop_codon:yes gene_type:complete
MSSVLINIILNSILLGIILLTQFVNYPLFKKINNDFVFYHADYTNRMSYVVAPIMTFELLTVTIIFFNNPITNLTLIILLTTILIWASTFFIQVPIHNKIGYKKDIHKINRLIKSNLIRTSLWSVKLIFSILLFL